MVENGLALASVGVTLVNYVVWTAGIGLLLWIAIDAVRVNRHYSEEYLVGSLEGEIERESVEPES